MAHAGGRPKGTTGTSDCQLISTFLRKRRMGFREVVRRSGLAPATASSSLKRLTKMGIIGVTLEGKRPVYRLADQDLAEKLVIRPEIKKRLSHLAKLLPRLGQAAAVQNDSMWIDSIGALHIFGEVKNTGDVWLQFVKITGTLRDSAGAIVDVVFTYTLLNFVPPDAVAPFNIIEIDTAKSARVTSYSLLLEFQEATALSQQLTVLNVADSKNPLGWLEVVGEVENHAASPSAYTQVIGTFYAADDRVIYVHFTYTNPSEIPPGTKHPFKITVGSDERSSKIARYSLTAESEDSGYTSVSETTTSATTTLEETTTPVSCLIADHLVINEVELNPVGNDTANEWVELYNPTTATIDLTGWAIKNRPAENQLTVAISSGTVGPNGYYTVTYSTQWLDNKNETLTLVDNNQHEIDETPWLNDTEYEDLEGYSWQRYPDGCDDWVFAPSTSLTVNVPELFSPLAAALVTMLSSVFIVRQRIKTRRVRSQHPI